ncbi:hypothetical protein TNCV_3508431 [Trichonephila clavipes]|nr:hypothetical protein TNCV_3508431 [Trichonephila clavipes]
MTAQRYVHDIQQPHVLPLIQRLSGAIFSARQCSASHSKECHKDCLRTVTTLLGLPDPQISLQSSISGIIWDERVRYPTSLSELEARL